MPQARIILRIDISRRAADRLPAICDRFGCTQVSALSKLVEWYDQLPDRLQRNVVGLMSDSRQCTRAIVQHLIDKKK